jgi:dihydroorotate dehydrogenase electron transfer subunit
LARVDLEGEGIGLGVEPGRFAMVEAPGRLDCVLLRPYSYFVANGPDHIGLLIKDVGKGTGALVKAVPATPCVLFGPLGSRFPSPEGDTWMVAGGVGAAPFGVFGEGTRVLFGARSVAEAGFADALRAVGATVDLATDDGSAGFAGSVVGLLAARLEAERPSAVYTCGPTQMMAAVVDTARRAGVPAWVSLEERMGCGIGICRGCAHPDASGGTRCICDDGPVYDADVIFAREAAS